MRLKRFVFSVVHFFNIRKKKLWYWLPQLVSCFIVGWAISCCIASYLTIASLNQGNLQRSAQNATLTLFLIKPVTTVFGHLVPDLRLTELTLALIPNANKLSIQLKTYLPATLASDPASAEQAVALRQQITELTSQLKQWSESFQQSKLLPRIISAQIHQTLLKDLLTQPQSISQLANVLQTISTELLQGHHRYILLLQNSDELRATGGFMGSYVLFEIDDGVIQQLDVQDIYVPDGQHTGFSQPPAGVAEYLSSGKGWRLPDANWNPDFPTAAEDIMLFFQQGKVEKIEGVIAVNLPVVEKILGVTGPIYLPDFNQTVTAENLPELARADRLTFFPGSQQKRQFLHALFSQLKFNITDLRPEQLKAMPELFIEAIQHKDIQVFSRNPTLQTLSRDFQLSGAVLTQGASRYLLAIESNVGINKANRLVSRQVNLTLHDYTTTVQLRFSNRNPQTSLKSERGEYIDYQRLLVPASYTVHNLEVNGLPLNHWDEQLVTTAAGEKVKQVGFLVTVPSESTSDVIVEFAHPLLPIKTLVVQKQSGLPATPYHITTPTGTIDSILESDQTIQLP